MNTIKRTIGLAALLTLVVACATSPTGRRQMMLISPESAIVQSQSAYLSTVQELNQQRKLVTDSRVISRIQTITGRLIGQAVARFPESKDWNWSVAIIDEPDTLNAWCMAGGRMAIYTGIINKLKLTDDEIAQIMGHEIAHALANHTAERMSRAMATTIGLTGAAIILETDARTLSTAAVAAKLALELPNSRVAESEADRIGIELATRAGYKPEAAVSLWKKMELASGNAPPKFLSTHPSPADRQQKLAALVPRMKRINRSGTLSAVHPVKMMK